MERELSCSEATMQIIANPLGSLELALSNVSRKTFVPCVGLCLGQPPLVSQLGGAKLALKSECWEDQEWDWTPVRAFLAHLSVTEGVMWQDRVSVLLRAVPLSEGC